MTLKIEIIVCGMNGSGKSKLGKVLAQKLNFQFIDNEYLFFSTSEEGYHSPGTKEEAINISMGNVSQSSNFIFTAVIVNYGYDIISMYDYTILIEVPKDVRLHRVQKHSYDKFGVRVDIGGDLYESEKSFLDFIAIRPNNYVDDWIKTLTCPIIRVDGRKPIEENVSYIIEQMQE